MKHLALLTGPEDIGQSRLFWAVFVLLVVNFLAGPLWMSEFEASNVSYYLLNLPWRWVCACCGGTAAS